MRFIGKILRLTCHVTTSPVYDAIIESPGAPEKSRFIEKDGSLMNAISLSPAPLDNSSLFENLDRDDRLKKAHLKYEAERQRLDRAETMLTMGRQELFAEAPDIYKQCNKGAADYAERSKMFMAALAQIPVAIGLIGANIFHAGTLITAAIGVGGFAGAFLLVPPLWMAYARKFYVPAKTEEYMKNYIRMGLDIQKLQVDLARDEYESQYERVLAGAIKRAEMPKPDAQREIVNDDISDYVVIDGIRLPKMNRYIGL